MARVALGSVHGRFQPFHNGHLDYVMQAFERADFIFVGLTQIFRPRASTGERERDTADSNPLSYRDRKAIVTSALLGAGIPSSRFEVVPFPIESVEHLQEFIPMNAICFTTIVNSWNDEKVARLNSAGFQTEILKLSVPDNIRVTSGTEVRRLLRANDPTWARFVPAAVGEVIDSEFRERFFNN